MTFLNASKRSTTMRLAAAEAALAMISALYGGTPHTQQEAPPIKLGTSGSNVNDANSQFCCAGTLGSEVMDSSGTTYILSNNHVLARANAGQVGENIIQRGLVDTVPACSTNGTIVVGHLSKFITLNFTGGTNTVDAAIAQTVPGQVSPNGAILQLGAVSRATVAPAVNMAVEKSGRTTGLTSGTISSVNVSVQVGGYGPCGTGTETALFSGQFAVMSTTFSGAGDSGSLVVKKAAAGSRPNPVGLLFAGSSTMTIANPIRGVLSALGVTFVSPAATAAELANAVDAPADPRIEEASRVKDRYDKFLFTLPEVVGHGVGYSSTGSGKAVIQLFLRKSTDAARQAAPAALEGIPVEIIEACEIHPIPNCGKCASKACKH